MYYKKLQYWYKKYVPEALKALIFNIVFLPFNIFEGLKIINFQRSIKNSFFLYLKIPVDKYLTWNKISNLASKVI